MLYMVVADDDHRLVGSKKQGCVDVEH